MYHGHVVEPSGTPLGCTTLVKEGAVPNEHGTWLYGRGGWCDGLQVNPWRIDITKQVCAFFILQSLKAKIHPTHIESLRPR